MSINGSTGKIALVVLILSGFLYPSAAGIIKANTEPIGGNASGKVISFADIALIAPLKSPKSTISAVQIPIVPVIFSDAPAKAIRSVKITAYSSTPEETDDTPFITAMGTTVRDGIIATNQLPFGTQVRIPSLFGQKVFVVEDRMNPRMKNNVDIWMPSKASARQFGVAHTEIEILN